MEGLADVRPAAPTSCFVDRFNPVKKFFIPVARVADMLLNPGEPFHIMGLISSTLTSN